MSRYWDDPEEMERRIWRGVVVGEYGASGVSATDYIRMAKHGNTHE